jgi:hypothetical protein
MILAPNVLLALSGWFFFVRETICPIFRSEYGIYVYIDINLDFLFLRSFRWCYSWRDLLAPGRLIWGASVGWYPFSQQASILVRWPCERAPWQRARAAISFPRAFHVNTRSTFETSRCNSCNIQKKTYETIEKKCVWNNCKNTWKYCKHMQHTDETLATDVWNTWKHTLTTCMYMQHPDPFCNIQMKTLAAYIWYRWNI